jgi:hypothetical protein
MINSAEVAMSNDADLQTLEQLNRDYIDSVQHSDVRRFDEILAPEFYCSNPDGSLVDRAGFLKQTAKPVTISGLEAQDVQIRLMGGASLQKDGYAIDADRLGAERQRQDEEGKDHEAGERESRARHSTTADRSRRLAGRRTSTGCAPGSGALLFDP